MSRAEHPFLQEHRPWECATVIVAGTASVGHDLAAHVMIAQSHQPSRSVTISRYRRCRGESCRVGVGTLQNRFVEMWTGLQTARHADGGPTGRPDQRGHGASGRADEYGFEWMRDDAVRLLDALGIERADLVGHSMGANVAWLVASHYPDRVRQLVALDAVPPRGRRAFEPPQEPDADEDLPFDWPLYPAVLRELAEPKPDWWARLRDVTAPALIVGGGRDSHVDQATLADAASLVPDCRLVIVGGGHRLHVARTAELLSELTPFLSPTPHPADSST